MILIVVGFFLPTNLFFTVFFLPFKNCCCFRNVNFHKSCVGNSTIDDVVS